MTASPDGDSRKQYAAGGGKGTTQAGVKVCWGPDEQSAAELARRLWRNKAIDGELSQELPMPAHFDEASTQITVDLVNEQVACGPDPERHVAAIRDTWTPGWTRCTSSVPTSPGSSTSSNAKSAPPLTCRFRARSIRIADRSLLAPTPTARSPPTAGGDVELFGLIPWQHLGADVGPVDGIVLAADDGEALTA